MIEVGNSMEQDLILAHFRTLGFVFQQNSSLFWELSGKKYLNLTQRLDDTGNGIGDAILYLNRKKRIENQAIQKKKSRWSDSKIRNWVFQKHSDEIDPILQGAIKWKDSLTSLLVKCQLPFVVLVVMINNSENIDGEFFEEHDIYLDQVTAEALVVLDLNTRYKFYLKSR